MSLREREFYNVTEIYLLKISSGKYKAVYK